MLNLNKHGKTTGKSIQTLKL